MPAGSLATIAADTAFPALAEAMAEGYVMRLVQHAAGAAGGLRLTGIDVLNHKPGRRCTLRYRVETSAGGPVVLIAKWYRDTAEAERLYRRQSWLSAQAEAAGLTLGRAVGYDARRGVILQQQVEGRELRELTFAGDTEPFARAGRWLARLHALPASDTLETKNLQRELRKAGEWAAEVSEQVQGLREMLADVLRSMEGLAGPLAGDRVCVIHRDFYPANLLWDGETIWGIDFDQMALGDPGVDLGAFVSQTEKLALREGLGVDAVSAHEHAFLSAYAAESVGLDGNPLDLSRRLPLFRAYTLLHVASAEVRRHREGWQALTEAFVRRAREVTPA